MPEDTPRFDLNTFSRGEPGWDHTDTVETLDEYAIDRGPVDDRPETGEYDDELYYATDQQVLWGWDSDADDWTIRGGLGDDDAPLPKVRAESVEADEITVNNINISSNNTREYFIDPENGDDSNWGTLDKPLETIQEAVNRVPMLPRGDWSIRINLADAASLPVTYDEDIVIGPLIASGRYPHLNLRILGDSENPSNVKVGSITVTGTKGIRSPDIQGLCLTRHSPHFESEAALYVLGAGEVFLWHIEFDPESSAEIKQGAEAYGQSSLHCREVDVSNCDIGLASKRDSTVVASNTTGHASSHVYRAQKARVLVSENQASSDGVVGREVVGGEIRYNKGEQWHLIEEVVAPLDNPLRFTDLNAPVDRWDEIKLNYQVAPTAQSPIEVRIDTAEDFYSWVDQAGDFHHGEEGVPIVIPSDSYARVSGEIRFSGRKNISIGHDFFGGHLEDVTSFSQAGGVPASTWLDEIELVLPDGDESDELSSAGQDYVEVWGKVSSTAWRRR